MRISTFRPLIIILFLLPLLSAAQSRTDSEGYSDEPKSVSLASGRTAVPMELYVRKPVVEVKINGKGPFKFFVDTGAAATVMDQSLASELQLPVKGQTKIGDPTDPQGITANRNLVAKLELGDAVFSDLIAVSWDRSAIYKDGSLRGVLGMPLFRKLLLTIDYPQNRLIVANGSLEKGRDVIEYERSEAGLFGLPIKVGQADMIATIDTGAMGGLSFPSEYMEKLPLESKPTEIGRGRTVSGEAVIYGAKLKDSVRIGENLFETPNVAFFGRLRHLNLGYSILSQFAITIDQRHRLIKFEKGPAAPVTAAVSGSRKFDEYAGIYGVRRLTVENGELYLQRLSGPSGEGPKLKLTEVAKDSFSLLDSKQPRVRFVRDASGRVSELQVLAPDGNWESAGKENK